MNHTGQGAFAALLALALAAPLTTHAQDASEQKPGFFRQLGKSLADSGKQMVGIQPNAGAKAGSQGAGSIYMPINGAGKLPNLFEGDNHQAAQAGRLDWPRVALTFTEWGASLPCWTVEARIWTSPTASSTETFRTCFDAAVTETDDLGETAELNTSALWKGRDSLNGVRVPPSKPNTGAQRSAGPNPPAQPFVVNVSRPGVADRAVDVSLRVAWVSGFIQTADLHPGASGMLTPFKDSRLWIAAFKPDGNRDK
ncbi:MULTISPECIES: hypothetical protein [Xanthomonas]|uniref:hypothetical protein n=2 Tax=Xanthomonas TaxID=338 RepID=UPI00051DF793|nr:MULTISPECIES: hypothetical protein [Xanthomonas]ATB58023.1 hypothetical protein CKU38_01541 [Xanthomonas citri pv. fuscans]ATB59594.1 hypothetical protein CKU38_03215 [Xanthomonas citri pv. fuscans]ATS68153.1 hypothetical protein XcfCFBP6165P_12215 [Xanthomonas citri pv. phaseoli var. fuscans]ATS77247.1 hypothetical protein XcfCFBP6975P_17205 [Xanthomonas citri pv. phaseoli var. fuscans]KGK66959.1 hypothetical protein NB99_06005 [Xanthomonas citri pv. fuscans]